MGVGLGRGVITLYMYTFLFSSPIIDGFLSNIIKLLSQNIEVLLILFYTRLKINKT